MELDRDLISDIILFRQNSVSHLSNIVYDIKIKDIDASGSRIVVYFVGWDVSRCGSVFEDAILIDFKDYLPLLRQKRLGELGI